MQLLIFTEPRFFVIGKNRVVSEVLTFSDPRIKRDDVWLWITDTFVRQFIPPGVSYPWRISKYEFYSFDNEKNKFEHNGWRIEDIDIIYISSTRIGYILKISDQSGRLRIFNEEFNVGRKYGERDLIDVGLILKSIDLFFQYSIYNNWVEFDVLNENRMLKIELDELKNKLNSLSKI